MLDNNDITLLRGMFGEILKQNNADLKRELRDEIHALIRQSQRETVAQITEFIDSAILPQIADLQRDMVLVKRHLQLV